MQPSLSFTAVLTMLLLHFCPARAIAQKAGTSSANADVARISFRQAMDTLTVRGRYCIVAEGQPLRPFVDKVKFVEIVSRTESTALKMRKIALLFDYNVDSIGDVFY